MVDKAILTWRGGGRSVRALAQETAAADRVGAARELATPTGTIISGSDEQFRELESQGYRVKVLPDTNILRIGRYRIDVERAEPAPEVPRGLSVDRDATPDWPHHLVQLAGPPHLEWIDEIERRGVDVVEPLSGYGLFVFGADQDVTALRELPFVVWTGPLEPAYRISTTADDVPLDHISVGIYPPEAVAEVRALAETAGAAVAAEGRQPAGYGGEFATLTVAPVAEAVPALATIPFVRWVEPTPRMAPGGERETQIVAENLDGVAPPNTAPVTGYQAWLAGLGVTGRG